MSNDRLSTIVRYGPVCVIHLSPEIQRVELDVSKLNMLLLSDNAIRAVKKSRTKKLVSLAHRFIRTF